MAFPSGVAGQKSRRNMQNVAFFSTDSCKFPTEKIEGAQNLNFASKYFQDKSLLAQHFDWSKIKKKISRIFCHFQILGGLAASVFASTPLAFRTSCNSVKVQNNNVNILSSYKEKKDDSRPYVCLPLRLRKNISIDFDQSAQLWGLKN